MPEALLFQAFKICLILRKRGEVISGIEKSRCEAEQHGAWCEVGKFAPEERRDKEAYIRTVERIFFPFRT